MTHKCWSMVLQLTHARWAIMILEKTTANHPLNVKSKQTKKVSESYSRLFLSCILLILLKTCCIHMLWSATNPEIVVSHEIPCRPWQMRKIENFCNCPTYPISKKSNIILNLSVIRWPLNMHRKFTSWYKKTNLIPIKSKTKWFLLFWHPLCFNLIKAHFHFFVCLTDIIT